MEVIYLNQQNSGNFTLRVLPEIIFSVPIAMFFPKNHFLANEINSKISILHQAGLIEKWISNYLNPIIQKSLDVGPQKLNIDQLSGVLYIYCAGCACAFVSLVVEIIKQKLL